MADDADREEQLKQLEHQKAMGEKAYDDMYEARNQHDTDSCYRDAKEWYYEAIGLARRLGLEQQAEALAERLAHIKAVYRSQFTQG